MGKGLISPSICACIGTIVVLASLPVSFAQVMESTNYSIQSDSINFGGGFSTSSNYRLESTAGEVGTGFASSSNYAIKAGYQQMQEVYIAISEANNVSLSPSIPGVSGGVSNGSADVVVTTDSAAGYSLTIKATGNPAMQKGGDSIVDYTPSGNPDFTFTTIAGDAHFGFTPEGDDIVQRFKDNGSLCNTGALDTGLACWDGLSTTEETVSLRTVSNHPQGSTTTIHFRVGVGSSVVQPPGLYTATTTLTAIAL